MVQIEVVFAKPNAQKLVVLELDPNTTVKEAILKSGLLEQFTEIDLLHNQIGIFGQIVSLCQIVQADDRIEIYQPLKVNPIQARRQRLISK